MSYLKDCCFVFVQVYLWYPLNVVTGGTTAKIMVAAKDNFLGKYIYKDTLARNLAAVIYNVSEFPSSLLYNFGYDDGKESIRKLFFSASNFYLVNWI